MIANFDLIYQLLINRFSKFVCLSYNKFPEFFKNQVWTVLLDTLYLYLVFISLNNITSKLMFLVQINLTDNICGVRTRWEILLVWCVAVVSPDHQLGQGWPGPPSPAQPSPAQCSSFPVSVLLQGVASPAQPSPAQPRVPCSAAPAPARAGGEMLGGDVDAGHQCTGHLTVSLSSHSALL